MIKIKCVEKDGQIKPAKVIPADAVLVLCDGKNYTIYFAGDKLPE